MYIYIVDDVPRWCFTNGGHPFSGTFACTHTSEIANIYVIMSQHEPTSFDCGPHNPRNPRNPQAGPLIHRSCVRDVLLPHALQDRSKAIDLRQKKIRNSEDSNPNGSDPSIEKTGKSMENHTNITGLVGGAIHLNAMKATSHYPHNHHHNSTITYNNYIYISIWTCPERRGAPTSTHFCVDPQIWDTARHRREATIGHSEGATICTHHPTVCHPGMVVLVHQCHPVTSSKLFRVYCFLCRSTRLTMLTPLQQKLLTSIGPKGLMI